MLHQFGKVATPKPAKNKPKSKLGAAPTQASIYAALKKKRSEEQLAVAETSSSPLTAPSAALMDATSEVDVSTRQNPLLLLTRN